MIINSKYFKRLEEPEFKQVFTEILNEYNLNNETNLYKLWKIYKTIDVINFYGDVKLEFISKIIKNKKIIIIRKKGLYLIGGIKTKFEFYCPSPDELYMNGKLQQNLTEKDFNNELYN